MKHYELSEVFVPVGFPINTYVIRKDLERNLALARMNTGKHILIFGQSKSGKSNLWRKHFDNFIKIPLNSNKTLDDVYTEILNGLEAYYTSEQSLESGLKASFASEVSAKLSLLFSAKAQFSGENSYKDSRKSQPVARQLLAPNLIIKYLKPTGKRIVLEDFHYGNDELKTQLAQDLKAFSDEACQFILISVQQQDLSLYNKDLQQRLSAIPVGLFSIEELHEIINNGTRLLRVEFSDNLKAKIIENAMESAALTQDICQKICFELRILDTQRKTTYIDDISIVDEACKNIAIENRGFYEEIVNYVSKGGRSDGSTEKYKWILKMIKETDTPNSGLLNTEVLQRLREVGNSTIDQGSVTGGLNYLPKLLQKRNLPLVFTYDDDKKTFYLVDKYMKFVFKWIPDLIDNLFE